VKGRGRSKVAEPLAKVFEEKAAKKITTVTIEAASL
jgi:hypothetical protein